MIPLFHQSCWLNQLPGLVNVYSSLWKMTMEIVDLPSYKMVDLSIVMLVITTG